MPKGDSIARRTPTKRQSGHDRGHVGRASTPTRSTCEPVGTGDSSRAIEPACRVEASPGARRHHGQLVTILATTAVPPTPTGSVCARCAITCRSSQGIEPACRTHRQSGQLAAILTTSARHRARLQVKSSSGKRRQHGQLVTILATSAAPPARRPGRDASLPALAAAAGPSSASARPPHHQAQAGNTASWWRSWPRQQRHRHADQVDVRTCRRLPAARPLNPPTASLDIDAHHLRAEAINPRFADPGQSFRSRRR